MAKFIDKDGIVYDTDKAMEAITKNATQTARRSLNEANEVVIRTGRKVADQSDKNHNVTREVVIRTGRKVADTVNARSEELHKETRKNADANTDKVLKAVEKASGDVIEWWKLLIAVIVAALADWGTYVAVKDRIVRVILDAAGNPLGNPVPDMPVITIILVAVALAAFFATAALLSIKTKSSDH